MIWALLSLALIVVGYLHCRSNAFSYNLDCRASQCTWSTTNSSVATLNFPKADLLDAEVVRIDRNGVFVDPTRTKEKNLKYGYSIRLKLRLPVEEGSKLKVDKDFIFAPYDISRRTAKAAVTRIRAFLDNTKSDSFNYSKGRSITSIGVLCMFVGVVSTLMACMFGSWIEAAPRRMKKAS
ncbi:hypothetical protein EON65_48860 [archaeon]|nr:MAG: hypothetical protein EON65_48860 [archaeon]